MNNMNTKNIIQDVLLDNNELDTIKINIDVFISLLKEKENDIESIPQSLIKKSSELQESYNCFAANYDARSLWEKKKFIASRMRNKDKDIKHTKPKLIIVSNDYTDETKCKKEFTGYLNKLTDVNKVNIYTKLKTFITNIDVKFYPILFDIIWNFIKVSSNIIYIDILYLFETKYVSENISNVWNNYIINKEWLPNESILNNNVLGSNDNNYDEYCEYVKWKKSSIALSRTWCYILQKENSINKIDILLNNLIESLNYYISSKSTYKHVIDIILDQIKTILELYKNKSILKLINDLDISKFESSSKFKIYNILHK